jgi:hypothetical protein
LARDPRARGRYGSATSWVPFDLETGAAYVAKSCSGLHLGRMRVNFETTNAARKAAVEAGRVDITNLRETVWIILLAPEAKRCSCPPTTSRFPGHGPRPGLRMRAGAASARCAGNSGQTRLSWSWLMADGHALASGTLTWPSSYSAPEAHAADLLRIAELGLRSECPPAKLPGFAPGVLQSGVFAIDARPQELAALQGELATTLRDYASSATCVGPGRQ